MKTAWADLPNAKYIDLILADLKANTDNWVVVYNDDEAYDDAYDDARDAVYDAVYDDAFDAVWDAASNTVDAAYFARGAILALIMYDDFAYLLDVELSYVQMIALLGNPAAVLLYPACIALNKDFA